MALIGYARVSTRDQETHMQLDALARAGAVRVYQEQASSVGSRPELQRCLSDLRPGDVLVVYKLDRVARSLVDLLAILDRVKVSGAEIRSLNEPLDTSTPLGVFMIQMLGAIAQLERGMIRDRVIAGQVAAIERGVRHGRPRVLSASQSAHALELLASGLTQAAVARQLGVSRGAVDRLQNPWRPRYAARRPVLGPLLNAHGIMR